MTDFNSQLGLRPGAEPASVVLDTRDDHFVAPDTIHFAVLTTLAEVAASLAVAAPVVPANVQVQLMSRARGGRLIAHGKVLKRGRRLAFAEGEVRQDDRLVAKATITFAILG